MVRRTNLEPERLREDLERMRRQQEEVALRQLAEQRQRDVIKTLDEAKLDAFNNGQILDGSRLHFPPIIFANNKSVVDLLAFRSIWS